jgi:hypothetical protein
MGSRRYMGQIFWPQRESVILSARPCPAGYPTDSVTVAYFSLLGALYIRDFINRPVHSLAFVFHRSEKGASAADAVCKW